MSNYTKQISWSGKDALSDSDPEKVISGGDFDTEFSAVQTAINSKIDDIVDDTTPQLGGDLDFQTHKATSFTSTGIDDNATSTAITIDASENVGIGTASPAKAIHVIGTGTASARLVRTGSDGQIIQLYIDTSSVGSVGCSGSKPFIANAASRGISLGSNVVPCDSNGSAVDNLSDLGTASARFDDIYATNGTIQTSDRNEKQDIEELSTAEKAVATACKGLLRKFRWQDSVAEKGDDARIHFGIIAQDLQDAFTAEGLDAGRYAMFISTTWYEKLVPVDAVIGVEAAEATYDDEGAELTPAVEAVEAKDAYTRTDTEDEPTDGYTERTRLGVRYPELLAFIISAM